MISKPPTNTLYSRQHDWIRVEGDVATVGMTAGPLERLRRVTQVEWEPDEGAVDQGTVVGAVVGTGARRLLVTPLSGRIVVRNTALVDTPELVSDDGYGSGWLYQLELTSPSEVGYLLGPDAYAAWLELSSSA